MLIEIDLNSNIPIYKQIVDKIIVLIAKGDLNPGDKLPSVRNLADVCSINPMTASKAYKILEDEGFIEIQKRSGAIVKNKGQILEKDLADLRQILFSLYASGMEEAEIRCLVEKYLEEICYTD